MKVKYYPKLKFPVFIHSRGQRTRTISVNEARELYRELGEVLKEIPAKEYEHKEKE